MTKIIKKYEMENPYYIVRIRIRQCTFNLKNRLFHTIISFADNIHLQYLT